MKLRVFFLILIFVASGYVAGAQDIIYKRSGESIEALIVDISPGVVKYKKFDKPHGSVYSIARDQVEKITYQNGKTVSFEEEEREPPVEQDSVVLKPKFSPVLGWHLGMGASSLNGDIVDAKALLASSLGASLTLPIGRNNSLLVGVDILSVGCGIKDFPAYDNDNNRWEFTKASEDLGYISLLVTDRFFLNSGRNYYIEGGGYGSFLMNANFNADAEVFSPQGVLIDSGPYTEELNSIYKSFDFGLVAGLGGRIPLGKSAKWHITAGARFYYGLTNIVDEDVATVLATHLGLQDYRESNIFGLIFLGVDIPTKSKQ
jgi:hypothetical protein